MSKMIEGMVECPFYIKEGKGFIDCEGIIEKTISTHRFKSDMDKKNYEYQVCCVNGGKKCPHFRNVSVLYERGERA